MVPILGGFKKNMHKKMFLLLAVAVLLISCAKKPAVKQDDAMKYDKDRAGDGTLRDGDVNALNKDRMTDEERRLYEQELLKKAQLVLHDVHFDYNAYSIREEDKPILRDISDFMLNNKDVYVMAEGHCDERGSNEYNLALGDQRAKAAKDFLIALGVPASRIEIISFGKERPGCFEHNEECWTKNRRAHFVLSKY
ncbi:Peptidoglycan-associated lipoprotein [Candidatus Magnetoovum chiemensis]|nr:Peptidoglycan-associated lipoprotein [Candidatus Magnetoovum chiemensis]